MPVDPSRWYVETHGETINTEQTQAAHGWIGGATVRLDNVKFVIHTPKAAVAVSSLDGQPIARSKKILITAISRVTASPDGKIPLLSEPVRRELLIQAPQGLKLIPLGADGSGLPAIASPYADGEYTVRLPAPRGTHWFMLTNRAP